MKKNIITSSTLLSLIVLTACLKSVWIGFIYFSLSFVILLTLFWLIKLIFRYLEDYFYFWEEDFIKYKAELINSSSVTSEMFEQSRPSYIKKYKKSLRKYKLIDIAKILFLYMIIAVCIIAMARGNFNF